jgi:hypothetical protein
MDVAIFIVQLATALVLAATLVAIIVYTRKTSEMATATRDLAVASQEQRYDQLRPLLIPAGVPQFDANNAMHLDSNQIPSGQYYEVQTLSIKNVGVGPALNVAAVLYGCASYITSNQGKLADQTAGKTSIGHPGWESRLSPMGRSNPPARSSVQAPSPRAQG